MRPWIAVVSADAPCTFLFSYLIDRVVHGFPTRGVQLVWQWLERTVTSQFTFFVREVTTDTL